MHREFTLAIIKPDAVSGNKTGPILAMINEAGFKVAALKMLWLSKPQAESFYDIHRDKPFFDSLVEFMISGPVIAMILVHKNAVEQFRSLLGDTDPAKAAEGTIRKAFGASKQMNSVHGSDSPENAEREADFFFPAIDRFF